MSFLRDWADAMPNTIIGLCLAGIGAVFFATVGIVLDSDAWFVAAFISGQVGTFAALGIGFVLDKRRADRHE